MKSFPEFMKHPDRLIGKSEQNTKGLEGYFYEGPDGTQMAFWECHSTRESAPHTHDFDEYMVCVCGEYVVTMNGQEHVLTPGDELFIPKGTEQGGRCKAGTRTIHAFGGRRIKR